MSAKNGKGIPGRQARAPFRRGGDGAIASTFNERIETSIPIGLSASVSRCCTFEKQQNRRQSKPRSIVIQQN
eukprot:scaffold192_cov190-Pinguiococcus_pyrenoidosus.AAC.13